MRKFFLLIILSVVTLNGFAQSSGFDKLDEWTKVWKEGCDQGEDRRIHPRIERRETVSKTRYEKDLGNWAAVGSDDECVRTNQTDCVE